ncbi:ABC-three component system protein [Lysinibacillus sp. NPDC047702]|uniref:ABC-three component system protein n=1 Tax=unclassified Lysinibacillus TaxID=2636778 RepID=UPI003CFF2DA2
MDFNLYLTTNYENLLFKYVQCDILPILMKDIDFSTQELFDAKRILHLHGYTSNSGSIVLSRESYQELYANNKYNELLKQVTGTKTLLFMGFSFEDQFIRELIKNHRQYFKGNHYIILDNPSEDKSRVLKEEYGLITVKYNSHNSSHSEEIRKILAHISEIKKDETYAAVQEKGLDSKIQNVVLGAQIDDFNQDVESNLFYQKLKIEDIEADLLELSKAFYVAAEIYIRDLKLNGMSVDVINAVLAKVLIKYKERYRDTYNKNGKNSNEFLDAVHETLENFDFGRLSNLFSENEVSDEDEKRGLIHILTNEEKINIWWGKNRIK